MARLRPAADRPALRVVGYVRVSTDEQASGGVSLDAQAEKVRAYCALHGLDLVELVADPGASARSLDRPGLARALDLLRRGDADGLVIAKLDRLTRSLSDWDRLISELFGPEAGRQLFSVSDSIDTRSAAGRLVLNVIMAVAQWEREAIAERTREALAHKRRRGERVGAVPYGSRLAADGVSLEPDPVEVFGLVRIRQLRDEGHSLRRIAAILDESGYPPKSGRRWSASSVSKILARLRDAEAA